MSEQTEFLYNIQPTRADMLITGPTDEERRIIGEHFAYVKALVDNGQGLLVGRTMTTGPETFGIVIFRASDFGEAQSIAGKDPAVVAGVMTVEVFPFAVILTGQPFKEPS